MKVPEVYVERDLIERAKEEGKSIFLDLKLKFSCFVAKRVKVSLEKEVKDWDLKTEVEGVPVLIRFRVVGSMFCGKEMGFEEFEMPVKEPLRLMPRWVEVRSDLKGDFGYLLPSRRSRRQQV